MSTTRVRYIDLDPHMNDGNTMEVQILVDGEVSLSERFAFATHARDWAQEVLSQAKASSALDLIPIPEADAKAPKRQNADGFHQCLICGRKMSDKAVDRGVWVEMSVRLKLIPVGHPLSNDPAESQGCFPVGSECAKKVPAGYRVNG